MSAGLISFSSALGIIFGANIGTTFTGWLVAIFGFKLKLGAVARPLIFIGASLKLFTKGRISHFGYAIAGFGLIFVGIATMQDAMSGLESFITPEQLPNDTLIGRLQLVALGIISTVITQSSSAGVAATLTALYAGVVNFQQAAALVIGMDVGTTVTALLATLGSSINARRTGLSHVLYNVWTACLAFSLITPYTLMVNRIAPEQLSQNAEIGLVAFHTCFNVVGVMTILPFTQLFARLIIRLLPSKGVNYTDELNEGLLEQPTLALNAIQNTMQTELLALLSHVTAILGSPNGQRLDLPEIQIALDETHAYMDRVHLPTTTGADWERLIHMIHAIDHLQRIHERCEEDEDRAKTVQITSQLAAERQFLIEQIEEIMVLVQNHHWQKAAAQANKTAHQVHHKVQPYRTQIVSQIAADQIDVLNGTARLEAIRWLRRVSKHISHITQHLNQAILAIGR